MAYDAALRSTGDRMEHILDTLGQPVKPYLPALSRFLIVATFYEDALRIVLQWKEQRMYLEGVRHFSSTLCIVFLFFNVAAMLLFSSLIIAKRHVGVSVSALATVIATQAIAYRLIFNMMFFLRNVSIMGGLLMCLSETLLMRQRVKRNATMFSLPQLSESELHQYVQLAGRVLLVFLFIGFIFNGEWSTLRVIVSLIGTLACLLVIVGFRARWSATFLVSLLCIMNVLVNNWWTTEGSRYKRDFARYDFFQTLSIVGGLLLLISIGPGGLSYDGKKKRF